MAAFRPGHSAHDAITRIYNTFRVKANGINKQLWLLDADIERFFDNVCHKHKDILEKLNNFPRKHLIKKWLIAGYLDKNIFDPTSQGTPQGFIISPLLANIALCYIEAVLGTVPNKIDRVRDNRVYVRYTDDFGVLCSSLKVARTTQIEIVTWLKTKNLNLAKDKTRRVQIDESFDFFRPKYKSF